MPETNEQSAISRDQISELAPTLCGRISHTFGVVPHSAYLDEYDRVVLPLGERGEIVIRAESGSLGCSFPPREIRGRFLDIFDRDQLREIMKEVEDLQALLGEEAR